MTSDEDLCFTSATEIVAEVMARRMSPVEVMTALARRADSVNPVINALVTIDFDRAIDEARAIERDPESGDDKPLLGVPVSIKDLTETAGMTTSYGSRRFAQHVPTEDALVVERIRRAGGLVFAKTNTPEFGAGINTVNELFGLTRNPWDPTRTAGGSSGGAAAAVAAGLGPVAHATDHGCSVRLPASFNGLVGLRPTPGRVPDWPSSWVFDSWAVTGPLARTVADCELLFRVMAGSDDRVPLSSMPTYSPRSPERDVRGLRVGWSPDLGVAVVAPEIEAICRSAVDVLQDAGAVVECTAPDFRNVRQIIDPLRALRQAARDSHEMKSDEGIENELIRAYLRKGDEYSAADVGRAESLRSELWQSLSQFFRDHDVLITVTTQTAAFPSEQMFPSSIDGHAIASAREACLSCYAITMTGLPSISIPVGFTADGLPVGLQVIARRFDEATLFGVARFLEVARPWASMRPSLGEESHHGD